MTHHHTQIRYGDSLRLQPQLSKLVDRAVVSFVNGFNHEPDDMKGFDDPLFHLPNPAESTSKMCALRRWHGADWWMVLHEYALGVSAIGTLTRRVTILPDSMEPDTLNFVPDLVVTKGGARFILPVDNGHHHEFLRQVSLTEISRHSILEDYDVECLYKSIIDPLSRAWHFASLLNPDDATVFVS